LQTLLAAKKAKAADPTIIFMTSSPLLRYARPLNYERSKGRKLPQGIASSWDAFCLALRSARHRVAVVHLEELDHTLSAGTVIDQYRRRVPHIHWLLFDDDLGVGGTNRGSKQDQYCWSGYEHAHIETFDIGCQLLDITASIEGAR
jgi:hypothetical protein